MGWRVSYKKSNPEDFHGQEKTVVRILTRKYKAMRRVADALNPTSSRHNAPKPRALVAKKSKEKQRRQSLAKLRAR
eukprot:14872949-Alexandrium_andersonii.AAC.1